MGERPAVLIGERVLWLGSGSGLPKAGKVKWIGRLPEMGPDWAVGLELDEALPYGGIDGTWGHRKLFSCRHKHGLIVPLSSVILQPNQNKPGDPFGRTLRSCGKSDSQELAELAPPKPESKVGKLFRALSNDESSQRNKYEDLELPSTHLRNPNLQRQLAILGTLRRSNLLEQARLEGAKSEACLYSVVLEKEENVFRERRRMIQGREFKRSDDTLDRTSSVHSSRSGGSRRDRTSGIFSFFRWFKKEKFEDSGEDSPPSPSSPVLRRANGSISGSVDTLFSTATTRSFAFVPPSHYRPYGAANPPEIRICPGPETNTYRNRIRQRDLLRQKDQNISLREKYRLYASETLPRSVDRINEISGAVDTKDSPSSSKNSTFRRQKRPAPPPPVTKASSTSENSLPTTLANEVNDSHDIGRQHRRTLSEPSPTRYVKPCHVKGKRKAPSPPNNSNTSNSNNNTAQSSPSDRTLSLQRKKRRAPPPPIQRSPSDEITEILQRAFEDITGSDTSLNHLETASNASTVDISQADIVATDTLRLERGYLRPNREEKPMDVKYKPTSPVSPRPWYKRNAATRENSFSRSSERKKEREKRRVEDWMIESGIPRRPNHLPESRLNVFARMDKMEEKRRSQISILTNISELDREAAEIVRKNKEKQQAILANRNDRFYDGGNGATSNGYFTNMDQSANPADNLVSLFNSITNVTNVTVNSAFFLQDSNFRGQGPKPDDNVIRRVVLDEQEVRIVDNPNPIVTEPEPEPGPSGLGKIAKVTIEELDDFDKERNSKAQALYEANRLQRHQSPFIPTITEVSESTVTSPTSTVANTPSDPIAPPMPGTSTPSVTTPEQSKALQKVPIQVPASVLKPVVHVIWNCPRCTLENPRWKVTCEACDMWRPVPCEFKEVNPKHPLPLAVLRIVEPKDQNGPGTVKITEVKDDDASTTNNVPLTNGVEAKPDVPNDRRCLNLDLKDNKSKRSSQGLTISDLLFNTQGNSTPKDNTWYKDILNGLNLPPSTTTYKDYTNNLQRKQENSDKPLNTNKVPLNSNVPTPSASGSSISSLSSTNSEKPCTSVAVQRSTKGSIVEPEEIRKARIAFFEKYGQPSTSKTKQNSNVSSELRESDITKSSDLVKITEAPKISSSIKISEQDNSPSRKEDSKLPVVSNKLAQAENAKTKTAETVTKNLEKPAEDKINKFSESKLEQSPSVKPRTFSRNEESSVKDTQTADIPYKVVLSNDQEEDKRKLREMLKEMKHSLPKRSKVDKGLQKFNNTEEISRKVELTRTEEQVKNEIRSPKLGAIRKIAPEKTQKLIENNYKHGPSDKAEAYLVESETIVEEIKIKKPQGKVSSAAQTSAMVRQLTPQVKPPCGKEVVVPITVEEYTIQDGVLYTSVTKKAKRIGSGTFQLMRPRDFANIEAIKTKGSGAAAPTYANVSPEVEQPAGESGATSKTKEVEKLSLQLTEPQGLAHFRAGLASVNDANNMNTIAVNRLLRRLESAIANGQHELAAALAKELAQLKVNCVVTRQKPETPTSQIMVDMYVEDKENHQGPFPLQMKPSTTVEQLKLKVEREYEIPGDVQRWIIGKALAHDDRATLESMGVTESGAALYLYLVVPEDPALITPQLPQKEQVSGSTVHKGLNDLEGAVGGELHQKSGDSIQEKMVITVEIPEENTAAAARRVETGITIEEVHTPKVETREAIKKEEAKPARFERQDSGWRCDRCTLVNSSGRPGCAACGSERPDERETAVEAPKDQKPLATRPDDNKKGEEQTAKAVEEEKKRDYQKLVDLEKSDLIICTETFECPICIVEYQPYEGVVLRECLHVFCRACLANTVEYSDEAEVKCPFRNDKYTCDSTLLEREIKSLVTPEAYEQHLAKSIALAETKIGNAFHCKTPDCKGWCIFEDNVNLFRCPVCTHTNCLTCQAVHEGMDCKEFQEQLNKDSEVNAESKQTKEMLQEMVDRGEAMNCPTCQVVLMKKWGCDWLRCSMCKTEICWITRGPRWGPNGKGDTSGGCQCGVNGIKCHPKCTYCH